MKISNDDQFKIDEIRKNMNTQDKWLKGDYIDFYNRDVGFLLDLVKKVATRKKLKKKRVGGRYEINRCY